jgi:hypothetical protein
MRRGLAFLLVLDVTCLCACASRPVQELGQKEYAEQPRYGAGKMYKIRTAPIPEAVLPRPQGPPVTDQEKSAALEAETFCRKETGYKAWVIRWATPTESIIRFQCLRFPPATP